MKNIVYNIYDKVAEISGDLKVGINRNTVARELVNELKSAVDEGKINPEDYRIKWIANYDTDTEILDLVKENKTTELIELFGGKNELEKMGERNKDSK